MASPNKKNGTCKKARIFSNIFWFIDDQCTLNIEGFEFNYNNIYPDRLECTKEIEDRCDFLFLDLSIEVRDRK